ncbi:cucumber peeling cupredoxin-like [Gastrolobium bilobum]|uniref:cucumber peeling cupredoxin-like n=1 Tax=Gastrolobium bilobum TaxID=150636 RepID=UPI002AB309AA|nr:cucumber peeling cupredoxin-like [Gastrolobium bilobum]
MLKHQNPFVLSFSALFFTFICHCYATQFIVGDSAGWVIPPYPTYYSNWSHSQFIRAGDSLEFEFDPKFYNLIQVSQYEYEHCTAFEPLKVFNNSPAILPLKEKGMLFFTCTISNYCCLGQKIAIFVHEQNPPSPPPSPSQPPISPHLSPNGSAPQAHGISNPPATPTISNVSPSPVPSSTQEEKSSAVPLVCETSFIVSLGALLFVLGTFFLGFWVI